MNASKSAYSFVLGHPQFNRKRGSGAYSTTFLYLWWNFGGTTWLADVEIIYLNWTSLPIVLSFTLQRSYLAHLPICWSPVSDFKGLAFSGIPSSSHSVRMYYICARPSFPLWKGSGYETKVHSAIDARCTVSDTWLLCMWLHSWTMQHEWVGLVFGMTSTCPRLVPGPAQETVRIVLAHSDGEDRCSRSVSSVSLEAVGRPGATAVLHPERGQRLIKPRGRWATTTSVCVYPPVQHLARYWSFSKWSPPIPTPNWGTLLRCLCN